MRLTIKNARMAYVDLDSAAQQLDVALDGIEADDLLNHIDIMVAINYYGVTELLDIIGEEKIKLYFKQNS